MYSKSAVMRAELEKVGITLEEPKSPMHRPVAVVVPVEVDRDAVRAVLVERGASVRALEWLVQSCPSIEAARAFVPPRVLNAA